MKYLLICTLLSTNLVMADGLGYPPGSFEQGYQQGYQLGQCNGGNYCMPGAAPAAPAPGAGQDTYEGGIYQGIQDQQREPEEFHSNIEYYMDIPNPYDKHQ